jgi:hypothetical protein
MIKIKSFYDLRKYLLIFPFITLCLNVFADSPCSSFVIKAIFYSKSGKQNSGYLYYNNFQDGVMCFNPITEYDTIFHRILPNQIDYSKIRGFNSLHCSEILAVNKSVMLDTIITSDVGEGYNMQKKIPVASEISRFNYIDTISYTCYTIQSDYENNIITLDSSIQQLSDRLSTVHYALPLYINFDTINLIVLDTILWCGDSDQIQWINKNQISKVTSDKVFSYFRIFSSNNESFWIDFFSYDPKWTKRKIISSLKLADIDIDLSDNGGENVFTKFLSSLKQAIKSSKILYFVMWAP